MNQHAKWIDNGKLVERAMMDYYGVVEKSALSRLMDVRVPRGAGREGVSDHFLLGVKLERGRF